jgi:hypothetical protein
MAGRRAAGPGLASPGSAGPGFARFGRYGNRRKEESMSDLRSELLAIRAEHGTLTPVLVLEAATAEDHPLHARFEWDDTIAGHKYRLTQARELIRVVKEKYIDRSGNPENTRFFVSMPGPNGMVYEPAADVAADEFASKVALQAMEREWRSLRKRYERFAEFRDLVLRDLQADVA